MGKLKIKLFGGKRSNKSIDEGHHVTSSLLPQRSLAHINVQGSQVDLSKKMQRNVRLARASDKLLGREVTVAVGNSVAAVTKGMSKCIGWVIHDPYLHQRSEVRNLHPISLQVTARVHRLSFVHPAIDLNSVQHKAEHLKKKQQKAGSKKVLPTHHRTSSNGSYTNPATVAASLERWSNLIKREQFRLSRDGIVADHFQRSRRRKRRGVRVKGVRRVIASRTTSGSVKEFASSNASLTFLNQSSKSARLAKKLTIKNKKLNQYVPTDVASGDDDGLFPARFLNSDYSESVLSENSGDAETNTHDADDARQLQEDEEEDEVEDTSIAQSGLAFAGGVVHDPAVARIGRYLPEIACRVPQSSISLELVNNRNKIRGTQPFVVEAPHVLWGDGRDPLLKKVAKEGSPFLDSRPLEFLSDFDLNQSETTESLLLTTSTLFVDYPPEDDLPTYRKIREENAQQRARLLASRLQRNMPTPQMSVIGEEDEDHEEISNEEEKVEEGSVWESVCSSVHSPRFQLRTPQSILTKTASNGEKTMPIGDIDVRFMTNMLPPEDCLGESPSIDEEDMVFRCSAKRPASATPSQSNSQNSTEPERTNRHNSFPKKIRTSVSTSSQVPLDRLDNNALLGELSSGSILPLRDSSLHVNHNSSFAKNDNAPEKESKEIFDIPTHKASSAVNARHDLDFVQAVTHEDKPIHGSEGSDSALTEGETGETESSKVIQGNNQVQNKPPEPTISDVRQVSFSDPVKKPGELNESHKKMKKKRLKSIAHVVVSTFRKKKKAKKLHERSSSLVSINVDDGATTSKGQKKKETQSLPMLSTTLSASLNISDRPSQSQSLPVVITPITEPMTNDKSQEFSSRKKVPTSIKLKSTKSLPTQTTHNSYSEAEVITHSQSMSYDKTHLESIRNELFVNSRKHSSLASTPIAQPDDRTPVPQIKTESRLLGMHSLPIISAASNEKVLKEQRQLRNNRFRSMDDIEAFTSSDALRALESWSLISDDLSSVGKDSDQNQNVMRVSLSDNPQDLGTSPFPVFVKHQSRISDHASVASSAKGQPGIDSPRKVFRSNGERPSLVQPQTENEVKGHATKPSDLSYTRIGSILLNDDSESQIDTNISVSSSPVVSRKKVDFSSSTDNISPITRAISTKGVDAHPVVDQHEINQINSAYRETKKRTNTTDDAYSMTSSAKSKGSAIGSIQAYFSPKKKKEKDESPAPYVLVLDEIVNFRVVCFPSNTVLATFPISVASILGERSMEERLRDPSHPSELTVTLVQEPKASEGRWGVEATVTFRCVAQDSRKNRPRTPVSDPNIQTSKNGGLSLMRSQSTDVIEIVESRKDQISLHEDSMFGTASVMEGDGPLKFLEEQMFYDPQIQNSESMRWGTGGTPSKSDSTQVSSCRGHLMSEDSLLDLNAYGTPFTSSVFRQNSIFFSPPSPSRISVSNDKHSSSQNLERLDVTSANDSFQMNGTEVRQRTRTVSFDIDDHQNRQYNMLEERSAPAEDKHDDKEKPHVLTSFVENLSKVGDLPEQKNLMETMHQALVNNCYSEPDVCSRQDFTSVVRQSLVENGVTQSFQAETEIGENESNTSSMRHDVRGGLVLNPSDLGLDASSSDVEENSLASAIAVESARRTSAKKRYITKILRGTFMSLVRQYPGILILIFWGGLYLFLS